MPSLRGYQDRVLIDVNEAHRSWRKVLLCLATGLGKTVIAGQATANVMEKHGERDSVALYIVHRDYLADQVEETLQDFGLGHYVGRIQSGHPMTPWRPLQVTTIQTIIKRYKDLHWLNPKIVFIDEAHHAVAETWLEVINHFPDAYLFGLTASPARLDGKGLGNLFDTMVEGPSIRWAMDHGYLCEVDTYSVPSGYSMRGLRKERGDYSKKQMNERATARFIGNSVKAWQNIAPGTRTLNFAVSVAKSKETVAAFEAIGVPSAHIDGKTPKGERDTIMKKYRNGQIMLLSNVEICTEGFDMPECETVIISRPTASTVLDLQMKGRVMRPKPDGRNGILIYTVEGLDIHGDPDDEKDWSLDDGVARTSASKSDGRRTCKCCHFRYPIKHDACPKCGHEHVGREVFEDDNVEITKRKSTKKRVKKTQGTSMRDVNRAVRDSLGDEKVLKEIIRKHGYKPTIIYVWQRIWKDYWESMTVE